MLRKFTLFNLVLFFVVFSCTNPGDTSEKYITSLHEKVITIDSHTDTPMRFTRSGFGLAERHDPFKDGTKVDLPRMKEGKLDGIFMAVFLGQRERTEEGYLQVKQNTYRIFDSIYAVVDQNRESLDLVTTPQELKRSVKRSKHGIFIGIENGYAIGKELSLIDSFYSLGARYITLCHTRNNDICDSSTDPDGEEIGGLSDFGVSVVKRMNELGMMVDISHASDKSFYDVLEVSQKPVIASHSCARALCDNPRNLDDDMLRALSANGGVIQMCILSAYVKDPEPFPARDSAKNAVREKHGNYYELDDKGKTEFLKDWYQVDVLFPPKLANVSDVADHIDHMVSVAGIDHVGIGTDFDGGGGVEGCYDVSELRNITAELVKRGYSGREIAKIWGGNLMRVMNEVSVSSK